ncbi:PREDICTED: probable LRR receptor-like serine/threonine-protein kinase At1g12460 [Camelina sativa]|uniref:Probable LRR receptor-like serine/threonine-protein kinase At1g12460 n=1 Tax=Camelina sativa TaxID=90675 RepID=A0ABM0Y1V8_CAMSA|nr:PREDICTED: probable LRR receptor-like serine/threonine-protein kinase At1g12460 [Camelina sativa]XP_010494203.1 PREDICTED: probable LRR receptor-like serine/threonine-protein kinase At1g12460 [Camelina sativa]
MRKVHLLLVLVTFIYIATSRSDTTIDERDILLQFKDSISEDPYNSLASWVSDGDLCNSFNGVTCNSEGFVDKIVLWNTSLAGTLAPGLSNLKSVRVLTLFGNRFTGNLPLDYSKLETLWTINVSSNALSGPIPEFIGDLSSLRFLDLSKNGFSGEIPVSLFKLCDKTKFVSLSHNNLSGSIPASIVNCNSLEGFDLSYNHLKGVLPPRICEIPVLEYILVRNNLLSGDVSEEIPKCQRLRLVDLGSNLFHGLAPFDVLRFENITYVNVSLNRFGGEIKEIADCSESLEFLDASSNELTGRIPSSVTGCRSLKLLDLESNKLNGSIPGGIGKMERLSVIRLGNNSIDGEIPREIGSLEFLQVLNLHNLNLTSEIPEDISNCRVLQELDVSGNDLEGDIPKKLLNLTNLKILDLHQNHLNGSIPSDLGKLSRIQFLDLSQNSLSGSIPSSLGNLNTLTHFNVSYNNLSGVIPLVPVIQAFGSSAFLNNPFLCGDPLVTTPCNSHGAAAKSRNSNALSISVIIVIIAAAVILFGVCIVLALNLRTRKRRTDEEILTVETTPLASSIDSTGVIIGKLVLFSKNLPSKYEDWEAGTKALLDKENIVGVGSIGSVYRASFEGGVSIAVKKLETLGTIRNQEEFEQEIGRLGGLQHPNLSSFQGYYFSSTMQLIFSEFVPNGSLYDNLHVRIFPVASSSHGNTDLNWHRRFQIALGTAKALSFLHNDCKPAILHLNVKSTNILLDERYEAKLSDYGLEKFLPVMDSFGLTKKFHNAVGYIAPELAQQSLRASEKCDVYSHGVVLLELVTGRKPVESPSGNQVLILKDYVRDLLETGSASVCFDRRLRDFEENELIQVMKLGLICTSENPLKRPSMAEVVQVLESIRNGFGS